MRDTSVPDPLLLWRGIDDAVAREAARPVPQAGPPPFPVQRSYRPPPVQAAPIGAVQVPAKALETA